MLLTRLVEYAGNAAGTGSGAPPPYYKPQKIRWVLELSPDGTLASRALTPLADPGDPVHKNGVEFLVPSITKTSGIAPRLAVDTPEYLFGWVPDGGNPDRIRRAHAAFCKLTADWAAADPRSRAGAAPLPVRRSRRAAARAGRLGAGGSGHRPGQGRASGVPARDRVG